MRECGREKRAAQGGPGLSARGDTPGYRWRDQKVEEAGEEDEEGVWVV